MSNAREKLKEIIIQKSYKRAASEKEAFTLVSGKKTLFYFDLKRTLLEPGALLILGEAIWDILQEKNLLTQFDSAGGLTMGADPITFTLTNKAWLEEKTVYPLIVRKEAKEHGTKKNIEGHVEMCRRVLALEDVITTGGSLLKAIHAFRQAGLTCSHALAIIDRKDGGREKIEAEKINLISLFELEDFSG
jgi:orotate phosphoribosyltransferase